MSAAEPDPAPALEAERPDPAELKARVDELAEAVRTSGADTARALGAMHRDLVGERKALATRTVFEAVIAALDTLGTMRDGLEDERDQRVQTQLRAIIGTLTNVLQALGFSQFEVEVGEPFDPARMESLGYAAGERGIVLGAVRAGYRADDAVVRPAGVLIADPADGGAPEGSPDPGG